MDIDMLLLSNYLVEVMLRFRKLGCREVVDIGNFDSKESVTGPTSWRSNRPKCPSTSYRGHSRIKQPNTSPRKKTLRALYHQVLLAAGQ
jgi:hypothetical protein